MELVYLWVRKHKNIKEQGFNFSSKFECEFEGKFNHNSLVENKFILKIKRKKECLQEFYGKNINLTAIVGENGVGKSTLLEILANEYNPSEPKNIFFIFFDESSNKLNLHGINKKESISSINLDEINEEKDFKVSFSINGINLVHSMKTIYYSNILNENNLYMNEFIIDRNYSSNINISTTFLLNQRKLIETNLYTAGTESKTNFDKIYRSFRIQQIQNAIIMIKAQVIDIPFRLPKKLVIKNIDFKPHIENLIKSVENKSSNRYKVYKKILDIIIHNNTDENISKNYLSTNLIITFLLELLPYPDETIQDYIDEILYGKETSSLSNFYSKVKNKMLEMDSDINLMLTGFVRSFFENSEIILNYLSSKESRSNSGYIIELDILSNDFTFLDAYLNLIKQSEFFLDISWRGISSGEETFLYQFSIFYYLSKGYGDFMNLKIENEEAKNLIILIDEGEITLHPQWQKDYIDYLVKFLRKIFTQNIHIVLTTHSPFILSDIPNENIIFLNKYKDIDDEVINATQEIGNCKVLKDGINEKTFGANIHTLLSNGFFMDGGLMGEFAKEKIKDVLKFLKSENSIIQSKEEAKNIIEIIGEPFLKEKLMKMYNDKFQTNDDRIQELEAEIERLRNA